MAKPKKNKDKTWTALILLAFLLGVGYMYSPDWFENTGYSITEGLKNITSSGGGGGGGGGSGDSDGNVTTTTTLPAGNDIEEYNYSCRTMFVTEAGNEMPVIKTGFGCDIFDFGQCSLPPMIPEGEWQCRGYCPSNLDFDHEFPNGIRLEDIVVKKDLLNDDTRCVMNPTDVIPEDGFTDPFGKRPDCVCLDKEGGPCNWYDDTYGEEEHDEIKCGGSCSDPSICSAFLINGVAVCDCFAGYSEKECRWRLDDSGEGYVGEESWVCEGMCPEEGECEVIPIEDIYATTEIEKERGLCTCVLEGQEQDPEDYACGWHPPQEPTAFVTQECYGNCDKGLNCVEWERGQCDCVDDSGTPPERYCWELTEEDALNYDCEKGICPSGDTCKAIVNEETGAGQCVCPEPNSGVILCDSLYDPSLCDQGNCFNTIDQCSWDIGVQSCDCIEDWGGQDCYNWACDGADGSYCSSDASCGPSHFHQQVGDAYCEGWCCCSMPHNTDDSSDFNIDGIRDSFIETQPNSFLLHEDKTTNSFMWAGIILAIMVLFYVLRR